MTDGGIKIGSHDTGFWDASNPIRADKNALASGLSVDQALEKAKQHEGAEVVVVGADGKASVHALSVEDSFWSENKQVLISELDRDPAKKQNLSKTPLAIDNSIASAFSGQGAFLVDQKNNTTYLGDIVDQTTNAVKLKDSEKFLANPTRDKVDAAYSIARDGGNERHVDKTIANQALNMLQQNYRQTGSAAQQVGLLKPGDTKSKMEGLIGELNTLAGQESSRVADLRGQLKDRTEQWQGDLKTPTEKRNAAAEAWDQNNRTETGLVNKAAYNLREARMPGVHQLEDTLDKAKDTDAQAKSQMDSAIQRRVQAQSNVNELERLPAEAEGHLNQARTLESENRGMYVQIQSYVTLTSSQLESEIRGLERDISRTDIELTAERNKPTKPVNEGSHTTDPFAGGSQSGGSHTTDPFAGGSNKPSHTQDPFANGSNSANYRDDSKVSSLDRELSRLRRERTDLKDRENGLDAIRMRLAYTQDVDQLAMLFYNLDPIDRVALNAYKERKDRNDRSISEQNRAAQNKQSRYRNEIGGAQRTLSEANSNEETTRTRYAQTQNRVATLTQQHTDLVNNPRPDSHAEVKPSATAYQKAVDHKEATVGAKAPLTVNRDKTQAVVDDINQKYQTDKRSLDGQIANVQQSLQSDATGKINQTRSQVIK